MLPVSSSLTHVCSCGHTGGALVSHTDSLGTGFSFHTPSDRTDTTPSVGGWTMGWTALFVLTASDQSRGLLGPCSLPDDR